MVQKSLWRVAGVRILTQTVTSPTLRGGGIRRPLQIPKAK